MLHPLDEALGDHVQVHLSEFTQGLDLGLTDWGSAQGNPAELAARLADLSARDYRLIVSSRGHGSLERVREFVGSAIEVEAVEAPLANGFVSAAAKVAVATEEDFFGSRRHTRTAPRFTRRRTDSIADELEPGDFAVHRIHGVGRYSGITHRALAGAERDYLILEYAQGDRLFVPSDQVGMVARYLGGDAPRLHRLGGSDWVKATTKVKRAVKDMAGELVRLYSVRMSVQGHTFGPDTPWQHELEDAFPHDETGDQLTAIEDVKHDMELPKPMDRLICGDVGFGKTEVAIRAAFKAVMEGKQVAVLVPTTLLAEQHFISFSERYAPFPVKVAMLSRFVSAADQKKVIADAAKGAVDVVIGTHRLLSSDVTFKDLGLVVVDEEQRFGVAHKERLKKMRAHVDVLTMTATPIPRTLEMALTGIRDMSTIDTPPEDRRPVLTYVGPYDEGLALGAVRRELLREGQVFWVHNRVATIDRQAGWLQEQLPDARVVGRARPDGRGRPREADDEVLGSRGRRAGLQRDHRERSGRAEREHARRRLRAPARARADVSAARARRALHRAGVRLLLLPADARADRGGARAARDDQQAPVARQRVPDRAPRPGDPRRREPAGRRAARAHRVGRVRHVLPDPRRVGRRDEGRAGRRGEGAPHRPAREGVHPAGLGGAGGAPPRPLPADLDRGRSRRRSRTSATRRSTATARCRPRSRRCSPSRRSA